MSEPEEPTLRFRAGRFEKPLANAIASFRAFLIVMIGVVGFGFFYFVSGALGNSTSSPSDFFGAIPLMIGLTIIVVLLGKLYE